MNRYIYSGWTASSTHTVTGSGFTVNAPYTIAFRNISPDDRAPEYVIIPGKTAPKVDKEHLLEVLNGTL